jgi:hypothetical protein
MLAKHSKSLIILLFSIFVLCRSHSAAVQDFAPNVTSYRIEVSLDVQTKQLSGRERVSFLNSTRQSVDTLFLHLYPNAFRNDSTTLMKESPFRERIKGEDQYRGFIDIQMVKTSSGLDLSEKKIIEETLMRLPLFDPLLPGQSIDLDIEFTVKLPRMLLRMGYSGDDFMIAQWFPKMAVLQEDGLWNAHQYHYKGEFFADFGDYRVSITLPQEYMVGATGRLVEENKISDSTKTMVFRAKCVHDFAWAASPDYQVIKREVEGIEVSYFFKPEHSDSAGRILDYAEFSLQYYDSLFGAYPLNHFTIVDAKIGPGGGAMEYPALVTIMPSQASRELLKQDAMIIFHETAHQWWYGMVASNEFEEAWLDEGFAEYSTRRALEEKFGEGGSIAQLWGVSLKEKELAKLGYVFNPQVDPIVTKSWEFRNGGSYRSNIYFKASLVLETLRNYLGAERMNLLLKEYFQRYKFKHPTTGDFVGVVVEYGGKETGEWLQQLLYGTGVCDYQVSHIESLPVGENVGDSSGYLTRVELGRLGEVIIPVEVEIELENGEKIRRSWDGKERWYRIEIETAFRIKSAVVDPDEKIALEINVNNNSLTAQSSDSIMMRLAGECLFWLENWMHLITCF